MEKEQKHQRKKSIKHALKQANELKDKGNKLQGFMYIWSIITLYMDVMEYIWNFRIDGLSS